MKRVWNLSPLLAAVVFLSAAARELHAEESGKLSFNRDIRPILSENCFACHGFDAKKREAELRLDMPESALVARDGVVAIKPGDPAASEVWKRITSDDADLVMPPPASHKTLKPQEKETLRRWIAEGAAYQKHWAFEQPTAAPEPSVQDAVWSRNPVDRFILARLEREKLKPQPEADRPTLIRRVAFTLTGLPPTIEEVDAFLADKSSDAYEKMVDRYMASPRYGEEMARHWLDVARYADTHGLHLDNERQMYAYRDWVVEALNKNLPFDQFTVWQLAGDQLPNPTPAQLTATGFNRCNVTTSEGGSIAEEFLYRYAVDRASTTMQTWLGLTGGCAVCHDHKYDPLTTKEFYSFYSFFYDAADPAMDGNVNTTAPFVKLPTSQQQQALDAAAKAKAAAAKELERVAATTEYKDPANETTGEVKPNYVDVRETVFDDEFPMGSTAKNTSRNDSRWLDRPKFGTQSGRRVLEQANARFHQEIITIQLRPLVVPQDGKFEVWVRTDPLHPPTAISILLDSQRAWWGEAAAIDDGIPGLTPESRRGSLPKPGAWTKLELTAAEVGLKPGTQVKTVTVQESGGVVWWDAFTLSGSVDMAGAAVDPLTSLAAWKKMVGTAPPELPGHLQKLFKPAPPKKKAKDKDAKPAPDVPEPTEAELEQLRSFYAAYVMRSPTEAVAAARSKWEQARISEAAADDAIGGTMIYRDMEKPREAFVMVRGQYDQPADKVEPAVPAIFPPLKKTQPSARANRLDLARWLVSPEQPVTARVQANRLWQQIFGTGLVKTSADFGSQGEPPSHPELLDWLAVTFQKGTGDEERGQGTGDRGQVADANGSSLSPVPCSLSPWDTKGFVRMLVTSATFRQQARSTPTLLARDPENRLLARGPRFRLDAEQIRDNVLFVSGLINLDVGGEGVKSYQPPNIWEPVGYSDSNTRYYLQDHGPALYRRSIYAFLKRTAPPPFMSNFDGPNREQVCARRERSNTPLQALQLMNDVQHFEAARALAERAIAEGGDNPEERITFLYRTVLARNPEAAELMIVRRALDEQLVIYKANPKAAAVAIQVGESAPQKKAPAPETAAWTLTANLILNLDETVNRN